MKNEKKNKTKTDVWVHIFNPRTWEAEIGVYLHIQGQLALQQLLGWPELQCKTQSQINNQGWGHY